MTLQEMIDQLVTEHGKDVLNMNLKIWNTRDGGYLDVDHSWRVDDCGNKIIIETS